MTKKERFEEIRKHEMECIEKYGFYLHYVGGIDPIDCHTHGLFLKNLPELQLKLNLDPNQSKAVLNTLGDKLMKGANYKAEEIYKDNDVCTFPFKFMDAGLDTEGNKILRVIFSDSKGLFPEDEGCDPEFAKQLAPNDYSV